MTGRDDIAALKYLESLISVEPKSDVRSLLFRDFYARAIACTPEYADLLRVTVLAAHSLTASDAGVLVRNYLEKLPDEAATTDDHLLILCPKPVELSALQVALGRSLDEVSAGIPASGHHYFRGQLPSNVAGTELTYTLVCLNKQTNAMSGPEVLEILNTHTARLIVLIGMAAGRPGKTKLCDVVGAEQISYVAPGTRTDHGDIAEPEHFRSPTPICEDFAASMPAFRGWHDRFKTALQRGQELGVALPEDWEGMFVDPNRKPKYSAGVILSGEVKDETTQLDTYMQRFSGDAKALEMEAGGFAIACGKRNLQWVVLRGISDFGVQLDEDGTAKERSKDWQFAATVGAATAFLTWITTQSLAFGLKDNPAKALLR